MKETNMSEENGEKPILIYYQAMVVAEHWLRLLGHKIPESLRYQLPFLQNLLADITKEMRSGEVTKEDVDGIVDSPLEMKEEQDKKEKDSPAIDIKIIYLWPNGGVGVYDSNDKAVDSLQTQGWLGAYCDYLVSLGHDPEKIVFTGRNNEGVFVPFRPFRTVYGWNWHIDQEKDSPETF